MPSSLARRFTSILLAQSVVLSVSAFAQQPVGESRPRRVRPEWNQPTTSTIETIIAAKPSPIGTQPTIRVALSTDARSATISSTGQLMNALGVTATMVALDTSRVRVEPRLLSPLPIRSNDDAFQLTVAGSASRAEAEQISGAIKKAINEQSQITYDTASKTWGLIVGARHSRDEAEELRGRLEDAGLDASVITMNGSPLRPEEFSVVSRTSKISAAQDVGPASVRLAARTSVPSREVVASASKARLFSSSAPVTFASIDETNAPLRFNDRPYRGRIEVFANTRGTLTIVNELGLEDYVRGVVANELSPGGYPSLEALKAQAIAARTYAMRNHGQFMSQGYDLLPTTRSQVYRGLSSENPLSTRAVDETRGLVATYNGEPINALYTSTCGGRTEDSENIFTDAVPYLRGRECAAEGQAALAPFTIKTSRDVADLREEKNVPLARDIALLAVENFALLRSRVSDSWLTADASVVEVRSWLVSVARLARQIAPTVTEEVNRPPAFATALNGAVFGESRASALLNNADVEYFLAIRDASEVPVQNRADLALLVRDGYLSVYPDASVRPQQPLSRGRVLHTITRMLEARGSLQIQKATARPTMQGELVLRSTKGKDQPLRVSSDAFLFRQIGDNVYPVRSVILVGGEPVAFHVSGSGEVDYLEVRPAPSGAAADRFSPFANWSTELSLGQLQARLGRAGSGVGSIIDLRVASRGSSRRVIDLEVVGSSGIAHVRGGRIRSALGLREQLFVIDRKYDEAGHIVGFIFTGRGWGHGVGMCQVGAYGLAKQGWSYEQILKAYYTGIELTRFY